MNTIEKIEEKLHNAIKIGEKKNIIKIWKIIKSYPEFIVQATKLINKEDGFTYFNCPIICEHILITKDVDAEIYNNIANNILNNVGLARAKDGFTGNCDVSYLLKILNDFHFKLTEDQKTFVINEALLERKNKTKFHTQSLFDLRLLILENPNWNEAEKKDLIKDLFTNQEYDKLISDVKQYTLDMITGRLHNDFDSKTFFETVTERDLYAIMNYYVHETKLIWSRITLVKMLESLKPEIDERIMPTRL